MKNWTQREARTGGILSPESVNMEVRAAQSSISTIDRDALPAACFDNTNMEPGALHRVWFEPRWPSDLNVPLARAGEQDAVRDSAVPSNGWVSGTYQQWGGGWQDLTATPFVAAGFRGGYFWLEWSGCAYPFPAFSDTTNARYPGNPKYIALQIIANGVVLCERRGVAYHERFRISGGSPLPQGDVSVSLQFRPTPSGPDDPLETTTAGEHVPQFHLYGNSILAIGRHR